MVVRKKRGRGGGDRDGGRVEEGGKPGEKAEARGRSREARDEGRDSKSAFG